MSKLRITPIGTCRIHTPLRRAAPRYPIEVEHGRNYGFVHTSDEALQLTRFLQGDKTFQPHIAPLVARGGNLARYEAQEWQPSDLHIVEISSSKRIACGGDAVQSNYLYHHFADFFADSGRSKTFWSMVKKTHRRHLIYFLRHQRTFTMLSPEDQELLSTVQVEQQSFKAIKNDMAEIVERLGRDKLLFVTHVNAAARDGELIPSRDRLIRWVKMAAGQLDAPVFDPTEAMRAFGQETAMESGGLDLTHYTPAFYDRVYDEMHRSHIGAIMGTVADASDEESSEERVAALAAALEAMLETGEFLAAAREIHAAIAEMPDALPLLELRGVIRSRIGDYVGAAEDLLRGGDDTALSQGMRVALVEALDAIGNSAEALRVAENLLADEYESASLYGYAAKAAERLGLFDQATGYAKQAFRVDRADLAPALHALVLLTDHGSADEQAAWRQEILDNIDVSVNGAFDVSMWAIRHRDQELFAAALKEVAALDKGGTIDLLEDAYNARMYRAVALSMRSAVALGRLPRAVSERRLAILTGSLEAAQELAGGDQSLEAYELAHALLGLADMESSQVPTRKFAGAARKLIHNMLKYLRSSIREAYKDKDIAAVLSLGQTAGDLVLALPDAAVVVARSLHAADRTDEALDLMKRAHAENEGDFIVSRWTGRIAAMAGDYATAIERYGELRRSGDPQLASIDAELERFFSGAEGRALKQLRALVAAGEFDQAVRLAGLIKQEIGAEDRVDRELNRIHGMLRQQVKEVDLGESETENLEPLLRQMIRIRPTDERSLRRLARELMRQLRFAEAAEVWNRLHEIIPSDDGAARQRERCIKMSERRVAAWGSDLDAAA